MNAPYKPYLNWLAITLKKSIFLFKKIKCSILGRKEDKIQLAGGV